VCAVEGEAYARHCAAMLHSLLVHNSQHGVLVDYLHGDDTSRRGRRKLGAMVDALGGEIAFHRVDDVWVTGLPVKGFTGKATWYRICLDELLPEAQRVLYLDADLLVMESLAPLWATPLEGNVVAAVTNVPQPHDRPYTERPEIGGDPYFNAGVLILDLAALRDERLGVRMREHAVEHASRLRWRDQDVLNEMLHDRRLPLGPRWNCMNAVMHFSWAGEYFTPEELREARESPAVRHFEGPSYNKPWHLLSDPASQAQYALHREHTPWPRIRREGCTPMNVLRYTRRRLA
jgi:lipopolysaccharide biosynthesis glycosyltransferase